MTMITMFEKDYKGGTLVCIFSSHKEMTFSFWFKKTGKDKTSPKFKTLEECWAWVDKGMRT